MWPQCGATAARLGRKKAGQLSLFCLLQFSWCAIAAASEVDQPNIVGSVSCACEHDVVIAQVAVAEPTGVHSAQGLLRHPSMLVTGMLLSIQCAPHHPAMQHHISR